MPEPTIKLAESTSGEELHLTPDGAVLVTSFEWGGMDEAIRFEIDRDALTKLLALGEPEVWSDVTIEEFDTEEGAVASMEDDDDA